MKQSGCSILIIFSSLLWATISAAQALCVAQLDDPMRQSVSVLAAADIGSCGGCADPLEPGETQNCNIPAARTQVCAAAVVERVGEALINSLDVGVSGSRLKALRDCLREASDQLTRGPALPPPADVSVWQARRAIGLAVSDLLLSEIEPPREADLHKQIDEWLNRFLKRRLKDSRHKRLESKDNECPDFANYPAGWEKETNKIDRVNCALKVIAETRAELDDTGGGLRSGTQNAVSETKTCLQEGGRIHPTCCVSSDSQRRGDSRLGDYVFARGNRSFREAMGAFCALADAAGLLPPNRASFSDAVPDRKRVIQEISTLNPAELRAAVSYLAHPSRTTNWLAAKVAAKKQVALEVETLGKALKALDRTLSGYVQTPAGKEFLKRDFAGPDLASVLERVMRLHACHVDPSHCQVKED